MGQLKNKCLNNFLKCNSLFKIICITLLNHLPFTETLIILP